MADDEEGPPKAVGISEEEMVTLASLAATPGQLSVEEMATIVDEKSTAEALRDLLAARGGAIRVAGMDVPKRLIRLSLLQLGITAAPTPDTTTVSAAMSVLAIDAAASRRSHDIRSFAQAGTVLNDKATVAATMTWLFGMMGAFASSGCAAPATYHDSFLTHRLLAASKQHKKYGPAFDTFLRDAGGTRRASWTTAKPIWDGLIDIVDGDAATEFGLCERVLPPCKAIATTQLSALRTAFSSFALSCYTHGAACVPASPDLFATPEALIVRLFAAKCQSAKLLELLSALAGVSGASPPEGLAEAVTAAKATMDKAAAQSEDLFARHGLVVAAVEQVLDAARPFIVTVRDDAGSDAPAPHVAIGAIPLTRVSALTDRLSWREWAAIDGKAASQPVLVSDNSALRMRLLLPRDFTFELVAAAGTGAWLTVFAQDGATAQSWADAMAAPPPTAGSAATSDDGASPPPTQARGNRRSAEGRSIPSTGAGGRSTSPTTKQRRRPKPSQQQQQRQQLQQQQRRQQQQPQQRQPSGQGRRGASKRRRARRKRQRAVPPQQQQKQQQQQQQQQQL